MTEDDRALPAPAEPLGNRVARTVALLRQPGRPGSIPDRSLEAAALADLRAEVEALTGADAAALRERLALHLALATEVSLAYTKRAAASSNPHAAVALQAVALRASSVAMRLAIVLGATAKPDGAQDDRPQDGHPRIEDDE